MNVDKARSSRKERSRWRVLAGKQHGVIARYQLVALGLSHVWVDYQVRRGTFTAICPGIYRVEGSPETWLQKLMAACLWAGPGSAISHRCAAALLGFPGFAPDVVELSSPSKKASLAGAILHFVKRLDPIDITHKNGIPVATVIRTLIDLGSVVSRERVENALDYVLGNRMTSIPQLKKHLARLGGRGKRGAGVLRKILANREKLPTDSTLERRFLALVKAARIPLPETQLRVTLSGGNYRLDFVWESRRIVVECEGYKHHGDPDRWEHDRLRRNKLTVAGWRVLHFSWKEVTENPSRVIATLSAALGIEALPV